MIEKYPEVIIGDGQWGSVHVYDLLTQALKWEVNNPNHGVTNIAVGDVDKMAADAIRLLTDVNLRREMGKRARASATSRYSTDLIIPQYIEFYERVLAS